MTGHSTYPGLVNGDTTESITRDNYTITSRYRSVHIKTKALVTAALFFCVHSRRKQHAFFGLQTIAL